MGGNALKLVHTKRLLAPEYFELVPLVVAGLRSAFPASRVQPTLAYRQKESFGDMDVLVSFDPSHRRLDDICRVFNPTETVSNGPVFSFDYKEFQIDAIFVASSLFDAAFDYYSWNDLGNLVGRIAHKLGFKYGHKGLSFIMRDKTHVVAEIDLSTNTKDIYNFLDLDYEQFSFGFDTVEEIFRFVSSSKFFNRDIYLLDNRNAASRVRDSKRKTYNEFLTWLETAEDLNAFAYPSMDERGGRKILNWSLERAFSMFPEFKTAYAAARERYETLQLGKEKFNGHLVAEWTGLSGKELGQFMSKTKAALGQDFATVVSAMSADDVKTFVLTRKLDNE